MARPLTGRAAYRRGRWIARIVLHREPRAPGGDYRVAQVDVVTREGAQVVAKGQAERSHARRFAERMQALYDEGKWAPSPGPAAPPSDATPEPAAGTVGAWVDAWCDSQTYSEATRDKARVAAYLPRTKLHGLSLTSEAVAPKVIAAWVRELSLLTSPKTEKVAAPRTVRNVYDVVRRAIKAAVFEGKLTADPFAPLPSSVRPKAEDADPTVREGYRLSREEVELAVSAATGRWRAMWALLAMTGARLGEACALRWCDIRPDGTLLRRVVFARQVHFRTRVIKPTKTKATKVPPEHPALRAELDAWRAAWPAEYGRKPREDDLVIPSRANPGRPWGPADGPGGPLWGQDVDRAWKRHLRSLKLPAHRTHDWRHTFASLCADAGMREHVAARWTHSARGKQGSRTLYAVPSWAAQCREMLMLKITFVSPDRVSVPGSCTG